MRKIILAAALILIGTGSFQLFADWDDSMGQDRRGYGPRANLYVYMLRDELQLSDSQFEKVKTIADRYMKMRYQSRGDYENILKLRNAESAEIEKVLTAQQLDRYGELYGEGEYGSGFCCGRRWGRKK